MFLINYPATIFDAYVDQLVADFQVLNSDDGTLITQSDGMLEKAFVLDNVGTDVCLVKS